MSSLQILIAFKWNYVLKGMKYVLKLFKQIDLQILILNYLSKGTQLLISTLFQNLPGGLKEQIQNNIVDGKANPLLLSLSCHSIH